MNSLRTLPFILLSLVLFGAVALGQTTYTSTGSGTWSGMTWSPAGTPGAIDTVVIGDADSVTINQAVSVAKLVVGQGTAGVLRFDGTARAVTVSGDVSVSTGGRFITQVSGTATHTMSIGGDLTNNGIFDMSQAGSTLVCTVTFNKVGDQNISGSGTLTRFRGITLSKGAVGNRVVVPINVTQDGSALFIFTAGTWEQTAGTLSLVTGNQTIGASGSLVISGSASFSMPAASPTVNGILTVNTSGTFVQGGGNNSTTIASGGFANFLAGTVTLNGRLTLSSGSTTTIAGANITVHQQATSNASAGNNALDCLAGANLTFSSGTFTFGAPNAAANDGARTGRDLKIASIGTGSLVGSTFIMGDGNTTPVSGSTGYTISVTPPVALDNLIIQGGNVTGRNVLLPSTNLIVDGTITFTSGTLNIGTKELTVKNPIAGTATNLIAGSTGSMSIAGTAAGVNIPSSVTALNNLTMNNANGTTLPGNLALSGTLTLTSGNVNANGNTLTANTVSRTSGHVIGNLQKSVATGPGIARTFEVGTGSDYAPVSVTFANVGTGGNLTASTTSGEHPNISSSGINSTKDVNRYWTVTNGGVVFDTYDAVYTFVPGDIDGGADTADFIVEKYNGTWSGLTEGTRTPTSTQVTGATSFSDFAIGEQVPVFALSAPSINFGNVVVSSSLEDSVYVHNTGGSTLNLSSIASDNTPVFTVTPSSGSIASGDSLKVKVTFSPTSIGAASANIVFTHDAAGSPDTLAVSGTGIAAPPKMSNGTGGGDWNVGTTWVGGIVPLASENVVIQGTDSVYLLASGTCTSLTLNAGTKLALNAASLNIPGSSWTFNTTSTVYYNNTTTVQSAPAYGNMVYGAGNGGPNGNLTVNGDLTVTTATLRGISAVSGAVVHTVAGNVILGPGTGARLSAVNSSAATTATCTWNIGGSVSLTGNNSGNRLIVFESAGPHTGNATYNINGGVTIGATSQIQLRSSSTAGSSPVIGTINIKGNVTNNGIIATTSGATGTSLVVWLNGTSAQSYTGVFPNSFPAGAQTCEVRVDNAAGVVLGSAATVNTNITLNLVNGKLTTTPSNLLTCSATGTITGGGASSFISGPLARAIATGSPTPSFPIGDATNYTPVSLAFGTVSTGGTLTASSTAGDHPQLGSSGIFAAQSLNRYWTISNTGMVFDTTNAIFNFVPGDVDGGANPLTFIAQKYNGSWNNLTEGTRTATSMQVNGLSSFSDFAMGQAGPVTVTSNGTGGGDWNVGATWTGGVVPASIDSVVILGSDSVYVLANSSSGGLNVLASGRLTLSAKLAPTNVVLGGLARVFADTLRPTGTTTVQSTGTYEHALNGGRIPTATWNPGSTILISGAVTTSPASGNQNFHHVIWNSAAQTASLNMGWDSITIGGNITVLSTGTGRWQMCGPVATDSSVVTIMGDVIQSSGNFTTQGTSNVNTVVRIHHYGNINVTGGNFALSRGSQGNVPASQTVWYLHSGNFTMSNATTQNSNTVGYARFLFMKSGTQDLSLTNVTFAGGGMPTEVSSGTTLNAGTSVVRGSGAFTVNTGATLECGNTGGLDSTLAGTGVITLSPGAGYTFNGSSAQVTGVLLPVVVSELTANNTNGVALSDSVFVTDTLHLTSGVLHTGALTLPVGASGGVDRTSGHVNGKLNKTVVVGGGSGSQTYEIGDSTVYTPVLVAGTSYGSNFDVTASSTAGEHPSIAGSTIDPTKSVNRYYTLSGSPSGPSDVTFNFVAGDVDGGANTANFILGKYNSPTWTAPTVGAKTATSTQALGVTSFSEFAIGEAEPLTANVTFRVDMRPKMLDGFFLPDSDYVEVRGGFNGWAAGDTLTDGDLDSIYTKTLTLAASTSYDYKFYKSPRGAYGWEDGIGNRTVLTGTADTVLPAPFFNDDDFTVPATFSVNMKIKMIEGTFTPPAQGVFVRGNFNNWSGPVGPMTDGDNDSIYTYTTGIPSGKLLEYKFWTDAGLGWESVSNRQFNVLSNTPPTLPVWYFDDDSVANIPGFLASPSSIAFGGVEVADTVADSIYVYNTGLASLNISSVTSDNSVFSVTPNSGTLAVGESLLVVVFFNPDSAQAESGTLTFTHDAAGSPGTVSVSGTGYFAPPMYFVSLSPDSVFNEDPLKPGKSKKPAKHQKHLYPNWSNLLDELNAQGGFAPITSESDSAGGMVIGRSLMYSASPGTPLTPKWKARKELADIFCWVRLAKWDFKKNIGKSYANIQKTLRDKTIGFHTGPVSGFDTTTDGKFKYMKKQLTSLSPKKQNNKLFAELVALKVNIAASAMGKTPAGFGDLIYDMDGNMFDEMSVMDISNESDSMMTMWMLHTQDELDSLYSAVYNINRAFLGPLDTLTFDTIDSIYVKGKLTVAGQVDVNTLSFLKLPAVFAPTRIFAQNTEVESPEDFEDEEFDEEGGTPVAAKLYQNYPNPFNPSTTIAFNLREVSTVTVKIYNLLGQEVATLINGEDMDEGMQTLQFSADQLSSGVYFYRIDVQGTEDAGLKTIETRKMVLLK